MAFSFSACGDSAENDSNQEPTTAADESAEAEETETGEEAEAEEVEEAEPEVSAVEVKIGETIELADFVQISLNETDIKANIKNSVKTGNVTRITGPDELDGQKYVYIKGTIKNLSKTELPVYDFFLGQFDIDGYMYDISANDCTIISADGSSEYSVPPLTEYEFTMYAAVPDELADNNESITYRFGFYDEFDNAELAKNKSFEEDPISLCQYQYIVTLK